MSFHPIDRARGGRGVQPLENSVHCRPVPSTSRTHITISGDLVAHLHLRPGDCVRPLIGDGADAGNFMLERATNERDGYRLGSQRGARACYFQVKKDAFLNLPDGETLRFIVEKQDGRVICRRPSLSLKQAAE